jgi:hypothetical protein
MTLLMMTCDAASFHLLTVHWRQSPLNSPMQQAVLVVAELPSHVEAVLAVAVAAAVVDDVALLMSVGELDTLAAAFAERLG